MYFDFVFVFRFSTQPNNLAGITTMTKRQATRRTTVKTVLGTSRKTTKTKKMSKTTSWNKHEPCRNRHDARTSCCKREPNEPNATSWYKQELAMILCKMERAGGCFNCIMQNGATVSIV